MTPRAPETIHLWWMRTEPVADAQLCRWQGSLSEAERSRAARFRFEPDKAHYIAAHALTRTLLGRLAGCDPGQLRFDKGSFGKPKILHPHATGIRFNLSHTAGLVAVAAGAAGELGIDVEDAGRMAADLDVAKRFFAPAELAQLLAAPEHDRTDLFFRFWTLKESFIKATGEGLHRPLDSFAFTLDPFGVKIFADTVADARDDPAAWRFWERRPSARHHLAVALRGGPAMIEIRETALSHEDL